MAACIVRPSACLNTQPPPSDSVYWIGANAYPLQIQVSGKAMGKASTTTSTIRGSTILCSGSTRIHWPV